ncbi:MAG: hypothetical protein P1U86_02145 [Verrucomicrobiales bacterium]|nr:hypothetical protein [Verrucomicrobiales bacterium]
MKSDKATYERFQNLLSQLIDDEINEDGMRELTGIVKEHPACSRELRNHLLMDDRLACYENEFREAAHFSEKVEAALDAQSDENQFVDKVIDIAGSGQSPVPGRAPWLVAGLSLAASLILGLVILSGQRNSIERKIEPSLAIIETLVGEVTIDGIPRNEGDSLPRGILEVDGYVALEFYKGARINVAGPARLELIDPQRVICQSGKIRATVPPLARGFTVATSESEIVDLGTEFAMNVGPGGLTEVHVFDGEVEAYNAKRDPESMQRLTAGNAIKMSGDEEPESIAANPERFSDLVSIENLSVAADAEKMEAWRKVHTAALNDSRLIAYYDFEVDPQNRRTLVNRAPTGEAHDGAVIGASWRPGPWPGKRSLDFKHPGSRVRVNLDTDCTNITLATWIRVDGLDRSFSSILLTDGYEPGEIHWQFRQDGTLRAGLNFSESGKTHVAKAGFMDLSRLGRWFHLATVIDQRTQTVNHYLDGELFTSQTVKGRGIWNLGNASIGNWSNPIETPETVRSLNGAIAELMIFKVALQPDEIRRLALK